MPQKPWTEERKKEFAEKMRLARMAKDAEELSDSDLEPEPEPQPAMNTTETMKITPPPEPVKQGIPAEAINAPLVMAPPADSAERQRELYVKQQAKLALQAQVQEIEDNPNLSDITKQLMLHHVKADMNLQQMASFYNMEIPEIITILSENGFTFAKGAGVIYDKTNAPQSVGMDQNGKIGWAWGNDLSGQKNVRVSTTRG